MTHPDRTVALLDKIIDECDSEMNHAEHRKKIASMDHHISEQSHQDGRWHCAYDLQKFTVKLKADTEVAPPHGPDSLEISLKSLKYWRELLDLNPNDLKPRLDQRIKLLESGQKGSK